MKTQATIILIIGLFMAPGIAMSQSTGTSKSKELREKEIEKFFDARKLYDLDSVIAPSMRIANKALSGSVWSTSSDNYFQLLDNSRNSSLSFRKEFRDKTTINRTYDMEFTKDNKSMSIHISAEAREGKVQITILKPNGKNFKVMEVEDFESLNWNHTLNAYTEENKKEYEGNWQIKVVVQNAVGSYSIGLNLK